MRIVMVNTLYPPSKVGGAERSVAVLAEALAAAGHEVHAIVLTDKVAGTREERENVTVHRLPHGNVYWPFDNRAHHALARLGWHWCDRKEAAVTGLLRELLETIRPDVVHTNNLTGFGAGVVPLARELGLPVVHTLRDFSLVCARASLFHDLADCKSRCAQCRFITAPRMKASAGVNLVVGNSRYMIERHRSEGLFTRTPACTIYNAVPAIGSGDAVEPRDPAGPMRLGFAGAIKPEKGIEDLLAACARLPRGDWTLTVAGNGEEGYLRGLRSRYADLPIEWLGFVPISQFYVSVDAVAIPSTWPEPMPRMLIEAMMRGLPVVVSDSGGSVEVAELYPGATIYPRRDVDALVRALNTTIADGPVRHAPDADLVRRFGTDRLTEEYLAAYQNAIALHRKQTACG